MGIKISNFDELIIAAKASYERTQDVTATAKELRVSRLEVLEALGFSDEWSFYLDD